MQKPPKNAEKAQCFGSAGRLNVRQTKAHNNWPADRRTDQSTFFPRVSSPSQGGQKYYKDKLRRQEKDVKIHTNNKLQPNRRSLRQKPPKAGRRQNSGSETGSWKSRWSVTGRLPSRKDKWGVSRDDNRREQTSPRIFWRHAERETKISWKTSAVRKSLGFFFQIFTANMHLDWLESLY